MIKKNIYTLFVINSTCQHFTHSSRWDLKKIAFVTKMWSYIGNVFLIVFFFVTYSASSIQKLEEKYVLVAQSFSVLHNINKRVPTFDLLTKTDLIAFSTVVTCNDTCYRNKHPHHHWLLTKSSYKTNIWWPYSIQIVVFPRHIILFRK